MYFGERCVRADMEVQGDARAHPVGQVKQKNEWRLGRKEGP